MKEGARNTSSGCPAGSSVEEIRNTVVGIVKGNAVRVGDVAEVRDGYKD